MRPDIAGVARLIEIANRVADQPELRQDLRLLLISADDAPGLARDFEQLTPHLRVLSASRQALSELRDALGAGHASSSSPEESGATPPPLFLIGPKARLVAVFTGAQPAASVADDLKTLAARPEALPSDAPASETPNVSESHAPGYHHSLWPLDAKPLYRERFPFDVVRGSA